MKPWREVIVPHPDIRRGRFDEAVFAADLSDVVADRGPLEYRDRAAFFRKTYPTRGLVNLLGAVLSRLSGQGTGEPVIQIQTPFGGGKTHALIALYHAVRNPALVRNSEFGIRDPQLRIPNSELRIPGRGLCGHRRRPAAGPHPVGRDRRPVGGLRRPAGARPATHRPGQGPSPRTPRRPAGPDPDGRSRRVRGPVRGRGGTAQGGLPAGGGAGVPDPGAGLHAGTDRDGEGPAARRPGGDVALQRAVRRGGGAGAGPAAEHLRPPGGHLHAGGGGGGLRDHSPPPL